MIINTTTREEIVKTYEGDFELIRFTQNKNPSSGKWSGTATFAPIKLPGEITKFGGEVVVQITADEWDNFWKSYNGIGEIYNIFKTKMNVPDAIVPENIETTIINNLV